MQFKRYLVLGLDYKGKYEPYDKLHIRIKNGITSDAVKNGLVNVWTPQPDDKLYFFPGCTIPRFKIRNKYTTTIKPELATAAFMAPRELKSSKDMFDVISNAVMVDGLAILDWLEGIYSIDHPFVIKYKSLLANCEDNIIIDDQHWYKIKWSCPDNAYLPTSFKNWRNGQHNDYQLTKVTIKTNFGFYSPVVNSKLNQLNCTIYSQDAILKYINEGSVVIDEKRYEELRTMANSSDKENIILVMELMANADFQKSFVYLLLLLKEFSNKFSEYKKETNHVNFKALLLFLNLTPDNIKNIDIETMVTGLKKHKQFTRSNIQRISQFFTATQSLVKLNPTKSFVPGLVLRKEAEHLIDQDDYAQDEDEIQIPEE